MSHAQFQITVKMLLFRSGKLLALTTLDGYLDFPGGRVDESELELRWVEALRREVAEELGADLRFEVDTTVFVSKRTYDSGGKTHRVAAIFFVANYQSGEIALSDEHEKYAWIEPRSIIEGEHKFISTDEQEQLQRYL